MDKTTEHTSAVSSANSVHKKSRRRRIMAKILLLIACAGIGFGGAYAAITWRGATNPVTVIERGGDGNALVTKAEENVAAVAQKVGPSVVSIITSSEVRSYFGTASQEGAGTGIIVSKDGYILTNKHVVDGAKDISVVLADGTTYEGVTLIGSDPLNDIAFVKIQEPKKELQAASLGDSSSIKIGQQVVAIGNALGQYQNTVTSGIVSGTGRPVTASSDGTAAGAETLTDLIQTDAAINSGNSGGPLVNSSGQVIGINTAVATDANGIGFALPINAAKGVLRGVLADGKISRAYLGVQYLNITPEVAKEYDLAASRGAYVYAAKGNAVVGGGPADKAGLRDGDVILKVNDVVVGEGGSLSSVLGEYRPGETVQLTIQRGGKEQMLRVTLGTYSN